jgi:hypothetical protein
MNPAGEYLWGFGCVAHLCIVSELDSIGAKARSSRLCLRPSLKAGVITGTAGISKVVACYQLRVIPNPRIVINPSL